MKKVLVSVLAVLAVAFVFVGVSASHNVASTSVQPDSLVDPIL